MEVAHLEEDRKIVAERVEMYRRIEADRLEADRDRAAQLAAQYLEEDITSARLVATNRLETDSRLVAEGLVDIQVALATERLKVDAMNAERVAAERQKTGKKDAEKIAAERLREDVKLELEFAKMDRLLDAERSAQDVSHDAKKQRLDMAEAIESMKSDGERRHVRAASNKEGVEFIEAIKKAFKGNFEAKHGARVLFTEARDAVSSSMSKANANLFKRHAWRLFKEQWPNSELSRNDCERCYFNVALKQ
jgi:hypothetical protein